jgi:hypothetical protein
MDAHMDHPSIIAATRRWISSIVIDLNLCPFAERVFNADRIRYVVTEAADEESLRQALRAELLFLAAAPRSGVETSILIHPAVLADFLDYNEFIEIAERLVETIGLSGVVQIAGFHPHYRFADTEADDVENYTNRSPYPMLHLLREESVTEVAGERDDLLTIPERNIETLRRLGREKILEKLRAIEQRDT